jgi:hypothetical protein
LQNSGLFRRHVLYDSSGRDLENGALPDVNNLIGSLIRNICYTNAEHYLHLPGSVSSSDGIAHESKRVKSRQKNFSISA